MESNELTARIVKETVFIGGGFAAGFIGAAVLSTETVLLIAIIGAGWATIDWLREKREELVNEADTAVEQEEPPDVAPMQTQPYVQNNEFEPDTDTTGMTIDIEDYDP